MSTLISHGQFLLDDHINAVSLVDHKAQANDTPSAKHSTVKQQTGGRHSRGNIAVADPLLAEQFPELVLMRPDQATQSVVSGPVASIFPSGAGVTVTPAAYRLRKRSISPIRTTPS